VKRAAKWLLANPGVALTIGGLLAFGYLHLAYLFFYYPMRVSPDDVGLGYKETLVGAVALLLSLAVFWLSFTIVGVLLGGIRLAIASRRGTSTKTAAGESSKVGNLIAYAVDGAGAFLLVILLFELWLAHDAGRAARRGDPGDVRILGIPLFQSRADFASVKAVSGDSLPSAVSRASCLLYLGQSDGTTVLYDATMRQAIRVPSSSVAVSTHRHRDAACHIGRKKKALTAMRSGPLG